MSIPILLIVSVTYRCVRVYENPIAWISSNWVLDVSTGIIQMYAWIRCRTSSHRWRIEVFSLKIDSSIQIWTFWVQIISADRTVKRGMGVYKKKNLEFRIKVYAGRFVIELWTTWCCSDVFSELWRIYHVSLDYQPYHFDVSNSQASRYTFPSRK